MELLVKERLLSDHREVFDSHGVVLADVLYRARSPQSEGGRYEISMGPEELVVTSGARRTGKSLPTSWAKLHRGDELLAEASAPPRFAARRVMISACGQEFILESSGELAIFERMVLSEGAAAVGEVSAGMLKARVVIPDGLPSWFGLFVYCLFNGFGPRKIRR